LAAGGAARILVDFRAGRARTSNQVYVGRTAVKGEVIGPLDP
jgi:hypothetical protein